MILPRRSRLLLGLSRNLGEDGVGSTDCFVDDEVCLHVPLTAGKASCYRERIANYYIRGGLAPTIAVAM